MVESDRSVPVPMVRNYKKDFIDIFAVSAKVGDRGTCSPAFANPQH